MYKTSTMLALEELLSVLLIASVATSAFCQNPNPCQDPAIANLPFCDHNKDIYSRVGDLLGRLTAAEKISQLGHSSPAIPSLKIPAYQWWSEALHGVANSPGVHFGGQVPSATSFPQIIGIGATFNRTLFSDMAEAISTEARAMYNQGNSGITFFAPNINIFRDPRWGRGQETPGEDPYLTSQYAVHFAKGMQLGHDIRYQKTAMCCKHFAAYDLENWNGVDRHHFNAVVDDQDLIETYFPAFEACVREGFAASIMCSYNAVNGVPSCANELIQNKVVRDQWDFSGFFVSDCGAIGNIMNTHKYTSTPEDTVQAALRGGTDLNCGSFYQTHGMEAYNKGKINDNDLNAAVGRLFGFRIALGMFDPHNIQPYWNFTTEVINSKEHQELALEAARQSIVLLKNSNNTLPLDKAKSIALIGPNANATRNLQGNYQGVAPYLVSPLDGFKLLGASVTYSLGCDVKCTSKSGFADAVDKAKSADAVVLVIGLDESQESEGHDRTEISLPGMQEDLMKAVKASLASTTPLVVVVMSGSSVDIQWAVDNADAILWVGYPGQSGGMAIAEVVLGMVNPSGRLPFSMLPKEYVDQISFFNMSMRTSPGQTYRFYTGTPLYAFGDGLSYTTFTYKWTSLPTRTLSMRALRAASVDYEAMVTNTGKRGGSVSVLAFITSKVPGAPLKQLFDFQKVYLEPGASAKLFFAAGENQLSLVDKKGEKQLLPGQYTIHIGDLSHQINIV